MRRTILGILAFGGIAGMLAFSTAPAVAKTVAECNAEYATNKDAIKGAGQKKKDFVDACRSGTETILGGAAAAAPAPATPAPVPASPVSGGKTAKECDADYASNKAAIKAGGQTKKDFFSACRSGTQTVPTSVAPAAPPPVASPAPAPSPVATSAPAPMAPRPPATTSARPTGAGGSQTDAQAKARCPADTVVWVNTNSGVYHFAGTHNYGTTKQGTYMCEADAKAAGDRAAENEKHP